MTTTLPTRRVEPRILVVIALVCAVLWGVAHLGSEIGEGETSGFDRAVLLAFRQTANPNLTIGPLWLRETARDITALGGFTVLTLVTLAAVAVLLVYDRRRQALVFGTTAVVAQVAAEAIKHYVGRERPMFVTQYDLITSSSFPSGHSMMAPAVYFTLAAIIAAGELRPAARRLLMGGSVVLVVAIGISRVYLGVHWPTDVVAGWALGSAIALVAWIALQQRRIAV
nr:phosphatase PAP2 family protein [Polymorphobacter sp.]